MCWERLRSVASWLRAGYKLVADWLRSLAEWLPVGNELVADWLEPTGYDDFTDWLRTGCARLVAVRLPTGQTKLVEDW